MNQLIYQIKNQIPEEIIEYIISMIFDKRGYNIIEYSKRKKLNKPRMDLICEELTFFKERGLSIVWLRPSQDQRDNYPLFLESLVNGNPQIVYHTGVYSRND